VAYKDLRLDAVEVMPDGGLRIEGSFKADGIGPVYVLGRKESRLKRFLRRLFRRKRRATPLFDYDPNLPIGYVNADGNLVVKPVPVDRLDKKHSVALGRQGVDDD